MSSFTKKSRLTFNWSFIIGLFILFSIFSCKDKAGVTAIDSKDTEITLIIKNPVPLYNNPNFSKTLIEVNCKIKDNRNNPTETNPFTIVTHVNRNKDVTWNVVFEKPSDDNDYKAEILFVEKKDDCNASASEPDFFDAKILPRNGAGNNVKRKVKDVPEIVGKNYTYRILFSITKKADSITRYYSIDPELKGNN